ncbi:MAG: type I DNA topoisomerase [Candidatus Levybacteria bacterium]|nr:type I DNA topoisomerase [Candidatus Levybacteria bacterium]
MNLVIVESPTKARTIGKFLGKDYIIKASMGHVVDLPKSTLAIDIEHDFKPLYEQVSEKKMIIAELKAAAKNAKEIILATDPDREGEAIASHIADMLGSSSKFKVQSSKFARIAFHEITKEAIEEALKNPRKIDRNLVDAQTARRILDRLVGYKLSPLLWKKVRRGLSAGRVQSVALRLIVEREREIEKFGKEQYFTITALLTTNEKQLTANGKKLEVISQKLEVNSTEFELTEVDGHLPAMPDGKSWQAGKIEVAKTFDLYDGQYKVTKTSIDSQKRALEIVSDLKTKTFQVADVLQKATKRSPMPPYTTSTLQQDAARRLHINGKRTMSLAQKLYEEGYITYHRTDSITIGSAAMLAIINFVRKEYGDKYVPVKPRLHAAKQKLAQEAHEAIRPTVAGQVLSIKDKVLSTAGQQGWKLYEMIWRRAIASQMSDAVVESTTVLVTTNSQQLTNNKLEVSSEQLAVSGERLAVSSYKLKASGSVLVFDGFLKVNPLGLSDNRLPKFSAKQNLDLIDVLSKEHETAPPPRYNDASIIKTLEEKGIGRPSTYATIISTIESRQYILREEGKFFPTAIGIAVNDFLVINFSDIDDIPFTALIESELDNIAIGEKKWTLVMRDFYTPFEKKLTEVEGAERVKIAVEETDEKCPKCGLQNLIIRTGKFGKFLACPKFPDCKFTKAFVEQTGLSCPKCGALPPEALVKGGQIVVKKTRKGRKFYGCSNYPTCTFAAWKLEDIKNADLRHVEPQRNSASREKLGEIKKTLLQPQAQGSK